MYGDGKFLAVVTVLGTGFSCQSTYSHKMFHLATSFESILVMGDLIRSGEHAFVICEEDI